MLWVLNWLRSTISRAIEAAKLRVLILNVVVLNIFTLSEYILVGGQCFGPAYLITSSCWLSVNMNTVYVCCFPCVFPCILYALNSKTTIKTTVICIFCLNEINITVLNNDVHNCKHCEAIRVFVEIYNNFLINNLQEILYILSFFCLLIDLHVHNA